MFYRSDTRHPLDLPHALFTNGFDKRDPNALDPVVRFPMGQGNAPDIVPTSAVCFTRDFMAAPIFPVGDLGANSWVYVLDVDATQVYNTQKVQYDYASSNNLMANQDQAQATGTLWPMFGQERAANHIAAGDIVGAVEVSRHFPGAFAQGGTFDCLIFLPNENYTGPDGTLKSVQTVMNGYVRGGPLTTPSMGEGVVHSQRI